MGDTSEINNLKERFFFSAYNRIALDPAKHIHDEHLKFTPAPLSTVNPPDLILPRTPAFYTGYTQAGGKEQINLMKKVNNNNFFVILETSREKILSLKIFLDFQPFKF